MENVKENEGKGNTETAEANKNLRELDDQSKRMKYKYLAKNISHYDQGDTIKYTMKKRFACRSFDGDLENGQMKSKFMTAMKQFSKRCQNIQFSIRLNSASSNKEWVRLREVLKRQDCVRKMCIYPLTAVVTEQQFGILTENLKSLGGIKNLQFSFSNERIRDKGLQKFSKVLKRAITLKQLEFGCSLEGTTVKGFQALGNGLKRLSLLENVKLSFLQFESTAFEGLGQGLKGMHSKANIHMHLRSLDADHTDIEVIKSRLKKCSSMQNLRIEFDVIGHSHSGELQKLSQSLEALPLLKHLCLNFPREITKEIFKTFCQSLQSLSYLESLKLAFAQCDQIKDNEVFSFSQSLTKLCSLRHLTLSFFKSEDISDLALGALSQTIGDLSSLKNIFLRFMSQKPSFTRKGFEEFTKGLGRAKSLENIELYLSNFLGIEDKDVYQFMRNLQQLPSLTSFAIYFDKFPKLKKEGLEAIYESLKAMHHLQTVKLGFSWCNSLSKQNAVDLAKKLKELPIRVSCSFNYNEIN